MGREVCSSKRGNMSALVYREERHLPCWALGLYCTDMATETVKVGLPVRRVFLLLGAVLAVWLVYALRGVIIPLFLAFLLAYALDPAVDWLEERRVPRALAAPLVMLFISVAIVTFALFAIPAFFEELGAAAADLPSQLRGLEQRMEPILWQSFRIRPPHSLGEFARAMGDKLQNSLPTIATTALEAAFGTLGYLATLLSLLIIPIFTLYLLIDFDRIVAASAKLVPRRWAPPVFEVAAQVHRTLGGYVRGQMTANITLGALYALGLRVVNIRLAVAIGVFTGLLAFVPYVGFGIGTGLAVLMTLLDWQGPGKLVGVLAVMLGVQVLDALVITPRIVGKSVGLTPLEVLLTMAAAGTLFHFLGVLLAVPLGAVVKILVQRAVRAYLASDFYTERAQGK